MAAPTFKFTSFDLNQSVEVARILDEHGGLGSSHELAIWLGYSGTNNGSFLTRLANAKLFGFVEGPSSGIQATERGVNVIRPESIAMADRARLEAFESVPLYRAFLDHFHGQLLPDETGMRNALENRWEIQRDKSATVLTRLLDSAEQAGLFKVAGNRTKMVRPTFGRDSVTVPHAHVVKEPSSAAAEPIQQQEVYRRESARSHKLVDGALDLLPDIGGTWDENQLRQWLSFLESALRVVYKLPADQHHSSLKQGVVA
ncbi:MAG: hypothetical protein Q7L55_05410 [Actinomycetota bacterium]|nr:hypothetical protein [Actinomycetota bacterium]